MELTIRPASSDVDYATAIQLQREFLAWREICYGDMLGVLYKYDHPSGYEADLAKTSVKYGPPDGAFLLAEKDGILLGGVGLRQLEPSVCEMKRLWVRDTGRGLGLGRKLSVALMEQGRAMGYSMMRLDTGFRQPQAVAIYHGLGFRNIPAYYACPPDLEAILQFMECEL
jgi:putative acetyltransferase